MQISFRIESFHGKSQFSYFYILDEKGDSPSTSKHCLGILYEMFGVNKSCNHLIVAGVGATMKLLLGIKREYDEEMDWMIKMFK